MDRHPQQIKRSRQDKKKHHRNIAKASEMKTIIKTVMDEKKLSKVEKIYNKAVSNIDKMVNTGQLKKNTAARRKSKLARHLNSLNK